MHETISRYRRIIKHVGDQVEPPLVQGIASPRHGTLDAWWTWWKTFYVLQLFSTRFWKEKIASFLKLFMNFESRYFGRDDPLPMALGKSLRRLSDRSEESSTKSLDRKHAKALDMPLCLLQCWGIDLIHLRFRFDSLHPTFALKFLLGNLSGKVHHVHYKLASFAQRSFKRLPHEWAHLTKEKPCNLDDADDADYIWISEYIWWHAIWWYQSAVRENPFNRVAKLQSPPMRHARSLGGDTFSLTPRRRVRPSDSQGMVHGGICNRNRLHTLHNPCSWLQRMGWHRNCADLRLSCRSL